MRPSCLGDVAPGFAQGGAVFAEAFGVNRNEQGPW